MKKMHENYNRIINHKARSPHWSQATLFALAMMIPSGAFAQSIVLDSPIDNPEGTESSIYQKSDPHETFEQNQFPRRIPSSHRPTINKFYLTGERTHRSREVMRWREEVELRRERMRAEMKQRRQNLLLSQQAEELEGGDDDNEETFDDNSEPQPPIIVDEKNNARVVIQLGEDNEKNLSQSGEDNELGLLQIGKNNEGTIDQKGSKNKGAIVQKGQNNSASIRQGGSNNSATINLGN